MTGGTGRESHRARAAKRRFHASLESLEQRQVLNGPEATAAYYVPTVLPPRTVSHFSAPITLQQPIGTNPRILAQLDNDGKVVSGKDRQFDEWTITVHGPGVVVVTDATPNDGMLDDDIDTIELIGTDPRRTYVTAQVASSARVITDGTVNFNRLISENGVQSVILNGFNLTNTVLPQVNGQPFNVGPEVYLPGGVGYLSFNNVVATIDQATNTQPFDIVIGTPNVPLKQKPSIRIGHVFNSVVDSSTGFIVPGNPVTTPTVNIAVNGDIRSLEMVSATRGTIANPGDEYLYPVVGSTGRTAVRANSIGNLKVLGSARNLTASRAGTAFQPQDGQPGVPPVTGDNTQPFISPFSGLRSLRSAQFGGVTDAVGLDVDGPVGRLLFKRGIGDPTGVQPGATNLGYNEAQRGSASYGLLGGQVVAGSIHSLQAGPASMILQNSSDPDFVQLLRKGSTRYYARPGNALTTTAITSERNIDNVDITGTSQSSEIKAGFDYKSYLAGLDGTRSPSQIRRFVQRGDLLDSVVSASYRPGGGVYGDASALPSTDAAGPGRIRGNLLGVRAFAGGQTALGNYGAGVYARHKQGLLPPIDRPTRAASVSYRP